MAAPLDLPEALLERFQTVAFERLERIDNAWMALSGGTAAKEAEVEIFREVHTLEGDARVVGFGDVSLICQRLEDLLIAARENGYRVHEDVDIVVTMAIQFAGLLVRKKGSVARGGIDLEGFLAQIEQVLAARLRRSAATPERTPSGRLHLRLDPARKIPSPARERLAVVATTVYVESLGASGRSRERLRGVWEVLSREIAELEAMPIAPLLERHAEAGAELAREMGKSVDIVTEAGNVHVTEAVVEALETAVLHVVRNAIDHGLEVPAHRIREGKPAEGSVKIVARQNEDRVEMTVSDDGDGIDFEVVRRRARELGLASAGALAAADESQLAELLFTPGFSTRESVSEVSGRGVGLDAVRAAVASLGGEVRIRSTRGVGTTIAIAVPNRNAFVDVLLFRAAGPGPTFAVRAEWVAEDAPAPTAGGAAPQTSSPREAVCDPRDWIEQPRATPGAAPRVLRLRRGTSRCAVATDGSLRRGAAIRLCPTPPDALVEVVQLSDGEAVLLHPESLPGAISDVGAAREGGIA